ncbi:ROK family transcriptional regulator [Roseivivax sediminis]|uniref:Sugar kinase of the NBD/HSP70 family, may contain an N-terminal HTH domain n=1 Tax=Roseivivax sediminis TaxID=936889 RepID=A0A1I2CFH1_9RHOB|nr:ROK family protein [Roseivivax sediminis]SFE67109.1 Sugar kinase of the NBD/HSP70 family, may contain an N-terminal HTH domain [Roseivivax sediminis]
MDDLTEPLAESAPQGFGPLIAPMSDVQRPLRQQIFERVRASGAISRAQVAKDLGISPASVTTLTSDLIEAGFLTEVAAPRDGQDGSRGRPPVALGVRADAFAVCGIKLSDREHGVVILDFAGRELAATCAPAAGTETLDETLSTLDRLIEDVCSRAGIDRRDLSALGVGLPGFVDAPSGRVVWSPLLPERDVALAAAAEARLGLPVAIDNDANLVALAELWFGVGRRIADFAVVTIEHGVGMGLVLNHRLYRGARGLGMELGHTKVQLDGALCRCGQRGCLEAYVADYALAREAAVALGRIGQPALPLSQLLGTLHARAKDGDAAARSIFHRAGRFLAVGLANVVNLFDPELVILAGERMRYDFLYADDTLSEMNRLILETGRTAPRIEVHAWGDQLWGYGAAALALSTVTERHLGAAREEPA